MIERNHVILVCNKLFEPLSMYSTVISKKNYAEPVKKIIALIKAYTKEKDFLFFLDPIEAIADDEIGIISANKGALDKKCELHEKFHMRMINKFGSGFSHSYVVEESFADAYAEYKVGTKAEQQELIDNALIYRKFFNNLKKQKLNGDLEALVKKELKNYPIECVSYPSLLYDIQYRAYTDLAMRLFHKYKIRRTIEYLAIAKMYINQTKDHRRGVYYLNDKLDPKDQITDILEIPSVFEDVDSMFYAGVPGKLSFDFISQSNPDYKELAEKCFQILLPELLKEKEIKLQPPSFMERYLELKN